VEKMIGNYFSGIFNLSSHRFIKTIKLGYLVDEKLNSASNHYPDLIILIKPIMKKHVFHVFSIGVNQ
jgi:hypothetical protein